ncbi:hypothetical protein ONS95_009053 [Cadophora gregata]|uniref:uncharacterized protein n=1 Tax=Cadophora gregata TaxID=51156 RepID=UPI0026DC4291|nr:uncharacterized protein ONS95_009053 [Cadophora gregata]KAK0124067.1 hypothetical protein ONS95_009053 [Cadophora gregata]KAK0130401.1 hypothetical protein ONS96_000921 [Cadophora gregata f. sp. sojae]
MKTSMFLATLFAANTALAQGGITCNGDIFNNYCCEGGSFSGPVVSSFLGSFLHPRCLSLLRLRQSGLFSLSRTI